jgi:hypothetical protein
LKIIKKKFKLDIKRIKKIYIDNLGKIEKNIVEARGEPSYVSGIQKWKGTQPTLNNTETNIKVNEIYIIYFKLKPLSKVFMEKFNKRFIS